MNKILINGLLINEQNAGIGNYGCNIINNLGRYGKKYDISVLAQKNLYFDSVNKIEREYNSTYKRILAEQFFLYNDFRKHDLIHFIDYSSPLIKINKPFIVTIHDLSYYKYPQTFTYGSRKIKELIAPFSIRRASKIIVDSENTKKDVLAMFKVAESKMKIIYPGRPDYKRVEDIHQIENTKRKYSISGEYILYLGTLEPRKNILRLIDAYSSLVREGIQEKLVIAGKKGWLYQDIFKKVEQLGLQKKIIFTDFVVEEDKQALYSGAKVFVYPSLYEGFGLPPLEAMTCGTPVVVANASSLPEVVGASGLYVNPKDVHSIAQGIYDIIVKDELREKFKRSGLLRSKYFDWGKATKQVLETYDEILR